MYMWETGNFFFAGTGKKSSITLPRCKVHRNVIGYYAMWMHKKSSAAGPQVSTALWSSRSEHDTKLRCSDQGQRAGVKVSRNHGSGLLKSSEVDDLIKARNEWDWQRKQYEICRFIDELSYPIHSPFETQLTQTTAVRFTLRARFQLRARPQLCIFLHRPCSPWTRAVVNTLGTLLSGLWVTSA